MDRGLILSYILWSDVIDCVTQPLGLIIITIIITIIVLP